jgi:hypothetical protein
VITLRRGQAPPNPDWRRIADGRVWRLRRGRDFGASVQLTIARAEEYASRTGKIVRVVRDRINPERAVWVQFGDGRVRPGEPCPCCGSTDVVRTHPSWGRCDRCHAHLDLVDPADRRAVKRAGTSVAAQLQPTARTPAPGAPDANGSAFLDAFADVALYSCSRGDTRERCIGYGIADNGAPYLLIVDFPLRGGERIPHPSLPHHWEHRGQALPAEPFGAAVALDAVGNGLEHVRWRRDEATNWSADPD